MSGGQSLDERYFRWLYARIADVKNRDPADSYFLLCERLYKTEFIFFVANDDNRAQQGIEMRQDFLDEAGFDLFDEWATLPCSFFEMMIVLAEKAAFQTGGTADVWFMVMLSNLELDQYNDAVFHDAIGDAVDRTIDRVNQRTYEPNGIGGLFPLREPERDQREVELWYQLSMFLLENIDF